MHALHGALRRLEIVVEQLKSTYVSIPVLSPVTTYLSYLPRHEINSPREPEDFFLFTRKQSHDAFQASYPVDPPSVVETVHCLKFAFSWCCDWFIKVFVFIIFVGVRLGLRVSRGESPSLINTPFLGVMYHTIRVSDLFSPTNSTSCVLYFYHVGHHAPYYPPLRFILLSSVVAIHASSIQAE